MEAAREVVATFLAASVLLTKQVQGTLLREVWPVPRRGLPNTREGRLLAGLQRARMCEAAMDPDSSESIQLRGHSDASSMPHQGVHKSCHGRRTRRSPQL